MYGSVESAAEKMISGEAGGGSFPTFSPGKERWGAGQKGADLPRHGHLSPVPERCSHFLQNTAGFDNSNLIQGKLVVMVEESCMSLSTAMHFQG